MNEAAGACFDRGARGGFCDAVNQLAAWLIAPETPELRSVAKDEAKRAVK
jgi:hypothetical protein